MLKKNWTVPHDDAPIQNRILSQPWGDYAFAFRDDIIRGSPRIPCAQVAVLSRPHARSNRHSLLGTITADFCVVVGTSFGRGVIVASYASCMWRASCVRISDLPKGRVVRVTWSRTGILKSPLQFVTIYKIMKQLVSSCLERRWKLFSMCSDVFQGWFSEPIACGWLKIRYCIIALHALSCGDHRCDLSICAAHAAVLIWWSTAERTTHSKRETYCDFY